MAGLAGLDVLEGFHDLVHRAVGGVGIEPMDQFDCSVIALRDRASDGNLIASC